MSLGKQPDLNQIHPDREDYRARYSDAINYAHHAFDYRQLKAFALEYLSRPDLASLPEYHFVTVGKIGWIVLEGGTVNDDTKAWVENRVSEMETRVEPVEPQENPRTRDTTDYVRLYTSLDRLMTKPTATLQDVREAVQRVDARPSVIRITLAHYEENLDDCRREKFSDWVLPLNLIISELKGLVTNQVASRKAQQKLAPRAARATKLVKIKQQDTQYNVVSVNPADLLTASVAVLFNTKNRRLTYLKAGSEGFAVAGTTIKGFDETNSFSKTTRDINKSLDAIRQAPTVERLDTVMVDRIPGKTITKVTGRLNEDTIILRVF